MIALNGHHGSAWTCVSPCATLYSFGDAFARRGYVVLAVNVGHRTKWIVKVAIPTPKPTLTQLTPLSDDQDSDGPDNHPLDPMTVKRMGHFGLDRRWRARWNVLQRVDGFGNGRT